MAGIDDLVLQLGQIGLWIQAVGLVVVIWIIVQVITLYFNRKRRMLLLDALKKVIKLAEKHPGLVGVGASAKK
jgi:uncharacterized membrane protein YGL010W